MIGIAGSFTADGEINSPTHIHTYTRRDAQVAACDAWLIENVSTSRYSMTRQHLGALLLRGRHDRIIVDTLSDGGKRRCNDEERERWLCFKEFTDSDSRRDDLSYVIADQVADVTRRRDACREQTVRQTLRYICFCRFKNERWTSLDCIKEKDIWEIKWRKVAWN